MPENARFLAFIDRHYQTNNIEDYLRQSQIFWASFFGRWKAVIMNLGYRGQTARYGISTAVSTSAKRKYLAETGNPHL